MATIHSRDADRAPRRFRWRWLIGGLLAILLLGLVGFTAWATLIPAPEAPALAALTPSARVEVTAGEWLTFTPNEGTTTTGLIFYPGGRVDARAYAPSAQAIADEGFLVVIVPMPLNLAVFGIGRADAVIAAHPWIQHWAIGGHSLGGSMAAQYAHDHPDQVDGLVLWASYPAEGATLADRPLAVTSIYGTLDGLATPEKVTSARALLPADTAFVALEGGNHAQFGWYGPQDGDAPATLPHEEQQVQTVAATVALLRRIGQ